MHTSIRKENASVAEFESPIITTYNAHGGAALRLADESALAKVLVRADDDSAAAAQLMVGYGSTRYDGEVAVIGQRPTECCSWARLHRSTRTSARWTGAVM